MFVCNNLLFRLSYAILRTFLLAILKFLVIMCFIAAKSKYLMYLKLENQKICIYLYYLRSETIYSVYSRRRQYAYDNNNMFTLH